MKKILVSLVGVSLLCSLVSASFAQKPAASGDKKPMGAKPAGHMMKPGEKRVIHQMKPGMKPAAHHMMKPGMKPVIHQMKPGMKPAAKPTTMHHKMRHHKKMHQHKMMHHGKTPMPAGKHTMPMMKK